MTAVLIIDIDISLSINETINVLTELQNYLSKYDN